MFRRIADLVAIVLVACVGERAETHEVSRNSFAERYCTAPESSAYFCMQVQVGDTWESAFPDEAVRFVAQNLNRQNVPLRVGQWLIVPPQHTAYMDLAPIPKRAYESYAKVLVFSPAHLAWGLYVHGNLLNWGAAVGGADSCSYRTRSCRTGTGTFTVKAKYGPHKRSSLFPPGCRGKQCAPMPYFMPFNGGQGFHGRSINGTHESHGCVGMLHSHARWLSTEHVYVGLPVVVEPYDGTTS